MIPAVPHPWDKFKERDKDYKEGYSHAKRIIYAMPEDELRGMSDYYQAGYRRGAIEREYNFLERKK